MTEMQSVREVTPQNDNDMENGELSIQEVESRTCHTRASTCSQDETSGARGDGADMQDHHHSSDGAEGIVRAEAKTIRNIRFALICWIVAATTACGILFYKISSKHETENFKLNFDAAAVMLQQNFISILGENLNYAFIMSTLISTGIYAESNYKPPFPNVSISQFDTLTLASRVNGLINNVIWAPLLYSSDERTTWETFALSKLASKSETNSSSLDQHRPCYFCGEGNTFSNPTATISFPGVGTVTCALIQDGALRGYVGLDECSYYTAMVKEVCGCQKSADAQNQANAATTVNITEDSAANGLFRIVHGKRVIDQAPPPYSPVWQVSPSANKEQNTEPATMFNQMSEPWRREALTAMIQSKTPTFSTTVEPDQEYVYNMSQAHTLGNFVSFFYPVFDSSNVQRVVGSLGFDIPWLVLFNMLLPQNSDGIIIVLENTLGQTFTYQAEHEDVQFLGSGDLHDAKFESMVIESSFEDFDKLVVASTPPQVLNTNQPVSFKCSYRIRIYPSIQFQSKHVTHKPVIYTVIVVMAFTVTSFVFFTYDFMVRRLQKRILDSAKQSEAIVSSLFPALVRERLFRNNNTSVLQATNATEKQSLRYDSALVNHKARLRTFLTHPPSLDIFSESEPIADLYPNTTVLFADIAGFTAWSSEREPSQVFQLLESLYGEFDEIARDLGVFKVETIGDCYVAVTGLPEKMKHHAVVMVEFAFRCLARMHERVSQLELVLGPGTADLTMRVGLHSGPVTAGVLRGERARFQLFGDTMNVASRMESTGKPDKVHISTETAQLLKEAGKEHWLSRRKEIVSVKGKGQLQTYWAAVPFAQRESAVSMETSLVQTSSTLSYPDEISLENPEAEMWGSTSLETTAGAKTPSASGHDRLVKWTTDLLLRLLQKVLVKRDVKMRMRAGNALLAESVSDSGKVQFVEEVTEVIEMPPFDERVVDDSNSVDVDPVVRSQLRDYVGFIASLYRGNAFHNFEHACHVAMSASKLLKRIIAPDDVDYKSASGNKSRKMLSKEIHESTFGLSSDPLMQFAAVFSALIHDVEHTGVTNTQLVREEDPLAIKYNGKCVAEQRSIQIAWDALMETKYIDLRRCIYRSEDEKKRFRQLLVNAVIATDIADKDLSVWRKNRWDKVFHQESSGTDGEIMSDRKATIVFEYIILVVT